MSIMTEEEKFRSKCNADEIVLDSAEYRHKLGIHRDVQLGHFVCNFLRVLVISTRHRTYSGKCNRSNFNTNQMGQTAIFPFIDYIPS